MKKQKEINIKSTIIFNNIKIPYIINYGTRKNMYIHIKECNVIVKVPFNMSNVKIEKFINSKSEWIYKSLLKQQENMNNEIKYENGEKIKILGQDYTIKTEDTKGKRNSAIIQNKDIIVKINKDIIDYDKYCEEIKKQIQKLFFTIAKDEISAAMEDITTQVGIKPEEYKIRKLKRAWGNCSSKRKISINVDLVQYRRECIKYVVLHEVCHLKYMNHSKMFWNMVERYMPNYKEIKSEFKK